MSDIERSIAFAANIVLLWFGHRNEPMVKRQIAENMLDLLEVAPELPDPWRRSFYIMEEFDY